jgi:hypothetical protein
MFRHLIGHHQVWFLYNIPRGALLLLDTEKIVVSMVILFTHILSSHLRLTEPGGPGPRIYIRQEQGGPVMPPGTGFPFSSPRTTRKATAEVF